MVTEHAEHSSRTRNAAVHTASQIPSLLSFGVSRGRPTVNQQLSSWEVL